MNTVAEIANAFDGFNSDELLSLNRILVATLKTKRAQEAAALTVSLKVGDRVELHNIRPARFVGQKGTIVSFGRSRVGVQLDGEAFPVDVLPTCLRKIDGPAPAAETPAKRLESAIIRDIADTYSSLSPENVSCDGELPKSQVAARTKQLKAKLGVLFGELGRYVDECDAYDLAKKTAA